MSKQKIPEDLIKALLACSEDLIVVAESLKAYCEEPAPKKEAVKESEPKAAEVEKVVTSATTATTGEAEEKTYSFEDVRKVLAGISSQDDGKYKAQVKGLVAKYSSTGTLKGVPEESYAALVAETEALTNA